MEEPCRAFAELLDLSEDGGAGVPEGLPTLLVEECDEVVEVVDPVGDGDDDLLVGLVDAGDAENTRGVLLLLVQDLLGELHGGVDLEREGPDGLRALVHWNVLEELGLVVEDDLGGVKDAKDGLADVSHCLCSCCAAVVVSFVVVVVVNVRKGKC